MPVTPRLVARLRLAETVARAVPGAAADAAAARLAVALAGLPVPLLSRLLALCDMPDDAAAAALLADPELMAAIEGLAGA